MAAGVPVEGVGLLLGVDTIPDMFRTATNVTGDVTAAVILGKRGARGERADGADRGDRLDGGDTVARTA
jgi:Na+/H+-dicarboxylate symporter